jgi:hypothetical protein
MTRQQLDRFARKLSKNGNRGWLTPAGEFFESEETHVIIGPDTLGGHERAALDWLAENDGGLSSKLESIGLKKGFECWEDSAGTETIKDFMHAHGFRRVAPE